MTFDFDNIQATWDFLDHRQFEDSLSPDIWEAIQAYKAVLESHTPESQFISTWDYAVLWIPNDSTKDQIKLAYHYLAKLYHTDGWGWDIEKMQQLNAAKDRIYVSRGWK